MEDFFGLTSLFILKSVHCLGAKVRQQVVNVSSWAVAQTEDFQMKLIWLSGIVLNILDTPFESYNHFINWHIAERIKKPPGNFEQASLKTAKFFASFLQTQVKHEVCYVTKVQTVLVQIRNWTMVYGIVPLLTSISWQMVAYRFPF